MSDVAATNIVVSRSGGFTLIEILVVLALIALIATLLPQGFKALFARSHHQSLVQKTVNVVRECSIVAQQQQRSVLLGSETCRFPVAFEHINATQQLPLFHADGTASHTALVDIDGTTIVIEKLTGNVSVRPNTKMD